MKTMLARAGLLLTMLLAGVGPASGAEIKVTMKEDVVANDGRCSLREAIDAANTDSRSGSKAGECIAGQRVPVVDVILLRRGTYRLKRGAAGDDLNIGGDLDVTESVIIQGKGQKGTIIQNGIGDPDVVGDGDRLFHVDPGAAGGIDVTFSKLTLARGDVSCTGDECDPGGSAVDARGSGALTFEDCVVMRNASTCTGEGCGSYLSGAAIVAFEGGGIAIRGTTIKKNETRCEGAFCVAGPAAVSLAGEGDVTGFATALDEPLGDFTIDTSEIEQNSSTCDGAGCGAVGIVQGLGRDVAIRSVELAFNTVSCTGEACGASSMLGAYGVRSLVAEDVTLVNDEMRATGDNSFVGPMFYVAGDDAALRGAQIDANVSSCGGDGCFVGVRHVVEALRAVAENVRVQDEATGCVGEACEADTLLLVDGDGPSRVADVTLVGNTSACDGLRCKAGTVALWSGFPLRTLRTELDANGSSCIGEACVLRPQLAVGSRGDGTLDGLSVRSSLVSCFGADCSAQRVFGIEGSGDLTFIEPVFEENQARCNGARCVLTSMLEISAGDVLTAGELQLSSNQVRCDGEACFAGNVGVLSAATLLGVNDGLVGGNATSCFGAFCRGLSVLRLVSSDGTIEGTSFTSNQARCDGEECATGTGGALRNQVARLTIRDSELTGNTSDGFGGAIFNDAGAELLLEDVGLFENEAGMRGVMEFGGLGGAIYNDAASNLRGVLQLVNTEIRANRALKNGGGVANEGVLRPLDASVIADNLPNDCFNFNGGTGCQ